MVLIGGWFGVGRSWLVGGWVKKQKKKTDGGGDQKKLFNMVKSRWARSLLEYCCGTILIWVLPSGSRCHDFWLEDL